MDYRKRQFLLLLVILGASIALWWLGRSYVDTAFIDQMQ
jgi:hypothetical protein